MPKRHRLNDMIVHQGDRYLPRIEQYLNEGADANEMNDYGDSILQVAYIRRAYQVATLLMERGASLDMMIDRRPLVLQAYKYSYGAIFGYSPIMKKDGNVLRDYYAAIPELLISSIRPFADCVKALSKERPYVARVSALNESEGHSEAFGEFLEKEGAKIKFNADVFRRCVISECGLNTGEIDTGLPPGDTVLHHAAGIQDVQNVRFLLEHHANPNLLSRNVHSPLYRAIAHNDVETATLLIEAGSDVHFRDKVTGQTFLMMAAEDGYTQMVNLLLTRGVDKTVKDSNGKTALGYAKDKGHTEVVKILRGGLFGLFH